MNYIAAQERLAAASLTVIVTEMKMKILSCKVSVLPSGLCISLKNMMVILTQSVNSVACVVTHSYRWLLNKRDNKAYTIDS